MFWLVCMCVCVRTYVRMCACMYICLYATSRTEVNAFVFSMILWTVEPLLYLCIWKEECSLPASIRILDQVQIRFCTNCKVRSSALKCLSCLGTTIFWLLNINGPVESSSAMENVPRVGGPGRPSLTVQLKTRPLNGALSPSKPPPTHTSICIAKCQGANPF